jgi:hypothetical protein
MKTLMKSVTAAIFAAGALAVAQAPSASAATIAPPAPTQVQTDATHGYVEKVRHRGYWHYDYRRHGYRYRYRRPGYGYYYGGWWYTTPFWLSVPYYAPPVYRPVPPPVYGGGVSRHVQWCLNRYRSYNPRTDTFLGYDGRYHRCRSPWRP